MDALWQRLKEGGEDFLTLLPAFPERLSHRAEDALAWRWVELRLGQTVNDCTEFHVALGAEILPRRTKIWPAGVRASPAANGLIARPIAPAE